MSKWSKPSWATSWRGMDYLEYNTWGSVSKTFPTPPVLNPCVVTTPVAHKLNSCILSYMRATQHYSETLISSPNVHSVLCLLVLWHLSLLSFAIRTIVIFGTKWWWGGREIGIKGWSSLDSSSIAKIPFSSSKKHGQCFNAYVGLEEFKGYLCINI